MKTLHLLVLGIALASSLARAQGEDVLRRFAPVILQRCAGNADYITRFDYDGNYNGRDNWDNLEKFPLTAHVYTSAIETKTHWYLTYSFFHPRDWWPVLNLPHLNHENDLEGALVVVEKPAMKIVIMETVSHWSILKWSNEAALSDDIEGGIRFEGEHPIVDIAAHKHPVDAYTGDDLVREKGVIYRYHGRAEQPVGKNDRDVSYELLPLKDTLWAKRFEVGNDKAFGEAADFPDGRYGSSFNGDNYHDDGADAPWYWGYDKDHGLRRGDWLYEPAKAMRVHFPAQKERFSTEYLQSPFRSAR